MPDSKPRFWPLPAPRSVQVDGKGISVVHHASTGDRAIIRCHGLWCYSLIGIASMNDLSEILDKLGHVLAKARLHGDGDRWILHDFPGGWLELAWEEGRYQQLGAYLFDRLIDASSLAEPLDGIRRAFQAALLDGEAPITFDPAAASFRQGSLIHAANKLETIARELRLIARGRTAENTP